MRLELWTEGKEASLGEILDARERRGKIQRELMKEKPASLVSFTLNIPGPVKTFPFGVWLFDVGNKLIQQAVKEEEGEIIYSLENRENTGCESFYSLTLSPEKIKRSLATEEDKHPLGRPFEFDVMDSTGRKVSRQEMGFSESKGLLCGEPAF